MLGPQYAVAHFLSLFYLSCSGILEYGDLALGPPNLLFVVAIMGYIQPFSSFLEGYEITTYLFYLELFLFSAILSLWCG